MKKSERMGNLVGTLVGAGNPSDFHPCYLGYFECFNDQRYYEAHDVLEHLWLKGGRGARDYAFHKGLIQLAGGFVHLRLQHAHPEHPKHGKRLHPARRLFLLAAGNLVAYGPRHLGLDLNVPVSLAEEYADLIKTGDFSLNPWSPETHPLLPLPVED